MICASFQERKKSGGLIIAYFPIVVKQGAKSPLNQRFVERKSLFPIKNRPIGPKEGFRVQWVLLALWGGLIGLCPARHLRFVRLLAAAGLALSMGGQIVLLWLDQLLTLETGLPLHLCGLAGVMTIPLLWMGRGGPLQAFVCYLAAPAAFATLFFPAVIRCSHPALMAFCFLQLHVLLALSPLLFYRMQKPLRAGMHSAFLLGNGYLLFVYGFNRCFGTNYLFLRAAPPGTPLSLMMAQGTAGYIGSLEMLCMALLPCMRSLYCRK